MKELLRDQEVVTLLRRAPPQIVDRQWSLPVEISWTEQEDVDPFLPSIKREIFMSQRLLSSNNNSVKTVSFDYEFEEDDDKEEDTSRKNYPESAVCSNLKKEADLLNPCLSNSSLLAVPTKKSKFKWKDPELPEEGGEVR